MALDRQSIEKKDFPIGRRGYDPDAVDSHLAALAAEVEELKRSSRRRNDSLAAAASEIVGASPCNRPADSNSRLTAGTPPAICCSLMKRPAGFISASGLAYSQSRWSRSANRLGFLAATIHENRTSGADASAKGSFWGREKQDVFLAASMDGFTAAPERPFRDRGCACLTLHMNNAG